ncbi:MAG: winged helix-turn-helix transcriptional regulator [Candidatus Thermoplasmatota archaeon]
MSKQLEYHKQKIYVCLQEHPGLHISKIAETIGINISLLKIIIEEMINDGLLLAFEDAGFKRYYVNGQHEKPHAQKMNDIRKKIYMLVAEQPGLNLTTIAEMLNMRISLAEYHLFLLEKNGLIQGQKDTGFKRYYVKDATIRSEDRILLGLLRQEIPLKIILLLLKHKTLQHKDILQHFDLAPSTLTYHINKLLKEGIIDVQTFGTEKGYFLKNKTAIVAFLTKYNLNKMIETFSDTWDDLSYDI